MDSERSMSQLNLYPNASTIDAVNDELVIWTNSLSAVQNINRNTFLNLASQPVGLTDSQTLTNKTLTTPTINGATLSGTLSGTYTIGGTPTFPSSVTQNTVVQTLTNKTLTSPTITSPTITNATISADTLTGYTTSNSGTIYGVGITSGVFSTSNIIPTAALQSNSVLSGKLGLSSGFTGGVTTYTNPASCGGTFYYINLGGLKMLWGKTNSFSTSTSTTSQALTLPVGFFTTVQSFEGCSTDLVTIAQQYFVGNSLTGSTPPTAVNFYVYCQSGSGSASANLFVVGT